MKQTYRHKLLPGHPPALPHLAFLAVCFLVGIVLGQVFSGRLSGETSGELIRYLQSFYQLNSVERDSFDVVGSTLLLYLRYPFFAYLLGFSSLGTVLLPVLTLIYGGTLSFSVCCFTAAFGVEGVLLAAAAFGLRCAITLPCYFFLADLAWRNSLELTRAALGKSRGGAAPFPWKTNLIELFCCGAALTLGAALEYIFGSYMLRLVISDILN